VIGTITSWPTVRLRRWAAAFVVLAGVVVPVAGRIPRRDGLVEPVEDVVPQPGLVVVHEDGRRDVHRRDEHESLPHGARRDLLLHLVRDVDDLLTLLRGEPEVVGVTGHGYGTGRK
jgi:hypothetical protein